MKKSVNKERTNVKSLLVCFIIVFGIALAGSYFTGEVGENHWYKNTKPTLTPPDFVFPIVWTFLFVLIAFALYFNWNYGKNKNLVAWAFGLNFIFNLAWSFFYFKMQNPLWAFVDLIFLWLSIIFMLVLSWKYSKKAFYLLLPYLIWVSFAGVLNWLAI